MNNTKTFKIQKTEHKNIDIPNKSIWKMNMTNKIYSKQNKKTIWTQKSYFPILKHIGYLNSKNRGKTWKLYDNCLRIARTSYTNYFKRYEHLQMIEILEIFGYL